jgi:hypothetical protein
MISFRGHLILLAARNDIAGICVIYVSQVLLVGHRKQNIRTDRHVARLEDTTNIDQTYCHGFSDRRRVLDLLHLTINYN